MSPAYRSDKSPGDKPDARSDANSGASASTSPEAAVHTRLAGAGDVPSLQELDGWPSPATWLRLIANDEVVVLVERSSGSPERVIGVARYSVLWTTVPFLGLIILAQSARGRGLSRVLLAGLCEQLQSKGFVALLSSSQTDEPDPQAWHLHMGFESNGIIENIADEGVGELVYRLLLSKERPRSRP